MKSSPPSRSARSGSSTPAKSKAKTPLHYSDPHGANARALKRRAKRKTQTRRKNWLVWLGFAALTSVLAGLALGVTTPAKGQPSRFKGVWREYQEVRAKVQIKQVELKALQAQLEAGRKRLASFQKGSGREGALARNGFARPGQRILLFPPTPEKD